MAKADEHRRLNANAARILSPASLADVMEGENRSGLARKTNARRSMLIPLVQSIISAFNENLAPLDQAGGQKTSNDADDNLVRKRSVHCHAFEASRTGAIAPFAPWIKREVLTSQPAKSYWRFDRIVQIRQWTPRWTRRNQLTQKPPYGSWNWN